MKNNNTLFIVYEAKSVVFHQHRQSERSRVSLLLFEETFP